MARATLRLLVAATFNPASLQLWTFMLILNVFAPMLPATQPCQQFFAKQYAAPVYAAPLVQYYAGQDIQAEALAEKVARLVDKKLAIREQQRQQLNAPVQTAIGQHCAKCHSGATPKGGATIDGVTAMPADLMLLSLDYIKDDTMPKDHKVDPAVKAQLMEEFLAMSRAARKAQPVQEFVPPPAPQGQLQ